MKLVSVKDQPPDDLVRVHLVVEGYYDAVNGIFIEAATDSRLFGVVGWIPQQSAAQETCAHQHPDRKPDDTYCRDCGEHF